MVTKRLQRVDLEKRFWFRKRDGQEQLEVLRWAESERHCWSGRQPGSSAVYSTHKHTHTHQVVVIRLPDYCSPAQHPCGASAGNLDPTEPSRAGCVSFWSRGAESFHRTSMQGWQISSVLVWARSIFPSLSWPFRGKSADFCLILRLTPVSWETKLVLFG